MPTFCLDSSPDLYVGCPVGSFNPNNIIFIRRFSNDLLCGYDVATLNPKKNDDVLTVYGTEFKGDSLQKLANASQFRKFEGSIAVNCRGVTIIGTVSPNHWYTTIDNVVFDWSRFGVTVPDSVYDSVKVQLKQKDTENKKLNQQLNESKKQLEEEKKTVTDLKSRLSSSSAEADKQKSQEGLLEFIKQEYAECKKELKDKYEELQKLRDQFSALKCELKLARVDYDQ